jgi:hypothetical protein
MGKKDENNGSSVVKIDSELLKKVEDFVKQKENRFKYTNKKQFIDLAVYEYLKKIGKNGK